MFNCEALEEAVMSRGLVHDAITRGRVSNGRKTDECSIVKLWKEAVMSHGIVHDAVTRGRVSNGRKIRR
jgi:hypothetical protein